MVRAKATDLSSGCQLLRLKCAWEPRQTYSRLCQPGSYTKGLFLAALLLSSWSLSTSASINAAQGRSSLQGRLHVHRVNTLSRGTARESGKGSGNSRHLLSDTSDDGLDIRVAALAYDLQEAEAAANEAGAEKTRFSRESGEEGAEKAGNARGFQTGVGASGAVAGESGGQEDGPREAGVGEAETEPVVSPGGRRQACNFSKGKWVRDVGRRTAYTGHSCRSIRSHENCQFHGRNDTSYLDWRWEPSQPGCTLKSFDALDFLDKNRNKIMAFAGDSLSVNFEDAVRCQLSSVAREKTRKFRLGDTVVVGFKYPDFNFTVIHFASTFLVEAEPQRDRKDWKALWTVHVDRPGQHWARVVDHFDIFVFTAGPWFTQSRPGQRKYLIAGKEQPTFDGPQALRHALKTVRRTLEESKFKGVPVLLTASPTHYAGIKTHERGHCGGRETPLGRSEMKVVELDNPMSEVYRIQKAIFSSPAKKPVTLGDGVKSGRSLDFKFLDVTRLSMYRPDAHSQGFTGDPKKTDCIHWCLPGLPDTWVDILYAIL